MISVLKETRLIVFKTAKYYFHCSLFSVGIAFKNKKKTKNPAILYFDTYCVYITG